MKWAIKLIKNQRILCTEFDEPVLNKLFEDARIADARLVLSTDGAGRIVRILPPKQGMTWGDMWFLQNLQLLQRLEMIDSRLDAAIKKLSALEKKQSSSNGR